MQLLTVFISSVIFMSRIFSCPSGEGALDIIKSNHVTTLADREMLDRFVLTTDGRTDDDGQIGVPVRRRITFLGVALAMPLQLFLSRSIAASRRVRRDVTTTRE